MMKKTLLPKLQEDIQTDDELNIFLETPGLLVLDIYSAWCGPCLGMVGTLRKLKLDVGGDNLNYAICKADTIEAFKRFRYKSEPTWLLVRNHKAVNIVFGANVPKLLALIYAELRVLQLPSAADFYELNEYQPEEILRHQIKEDAKNKVLALELKKEETERLNYLNEVTDNIMENLIDMGVTIFGPQVGRDVMKQILQTAEGLKIQCKDRKTIKMCKEDFKTIHFDCPNPLNNEVLEHIEGKELIVCYWKVMGDGPQVPKLLKNLANELQISHIQKVYEDNEEDIVIPPLIEPIDVKIDVENEDGDNLSEKSVEKTVTAKNSLEEYLLTDEHEEESFDDEDVYKLSKSTSDVQSAEGQKVEKVSKRKSHDTKKVSIPAIWVPNNQRTHAALIYTYFRNQTVTFLPPDPQPEPPYVVMAFDAYKKKDVIAHAERFNQTVPMYGFFTSDEADKAKYITNSLQKYKMVTENDKVVVKVQRVTSRTMLDLVTYGPSYVSPNLLAGEHDVLKFFPPSFKTAQQEAEEEKAEMLKSESTIQTPAVKGMKKQQSNKTKVIFESQKASSSHKLSLKENATDSLNSTYISEASSNSNIQLENAAEAA